MTTENTTDEKDPNGFSVIDLQKEHLGIIDLLKSNSYPNVGFVLSTNTKEPENKLCFNLIEERQPFCVDTHDLKVSFQNKIENKIKAIFNI